MTVQEVEVADLSDKQRDRLLSELTAIGKSLKQLEPLEARRVEICAELRAAGATWVELGRAAGVTGEAIQQAVLRLAKKRAAAEHEARVAELMEQRRQKQ